MDTLLENKVAIVTGGTSGIGKAIAQKFVEQGANVIIIGTNPDKGKSAVEEIQSKTGKEGISFYQLDVSHTDNVHTAIKEILNQHKNIDILVNNAGIVRDQLLMRMTEDHWDQVMTVNLKSCFNLCNALIRTMMKARSGAIINVSSIIGLTGNVGQANYAASKAAIIGFTKSLAKEVGGRNIRVNCIAPGYIATSMNEELPENVKEDFLKRTPLGRVGNTDDVANTALFLASPMSDFITGQVITVDGGIVMGG